MYLNKSNQTMRCPYCDEEIRSNAKKCKHCGEWLTPPPPNNGNKYSEPIWPTIVGSLGILCYLFAFLDFILGSFGIADLTGVSWTPPLFCIIGYILTKIADSATSET